MRKAISKEIKELVGYVLGEDFFMDEFNNYWEYLRNIIDFAERNELVPVAVCNGFVNTLIIISREVCEEYKAGNLVDHYEMAEEVYV